MNSQKSVRNVQAEHKMNSEWIKHYQGYDLTPFDKHKRVRNFTPGPTNLRYHVFKQIGRKKILFLVAVPKTIHYWIFSNDHLVRVTA